MYNLTSRACVFTALSAALYLISPVSIATGSPPSDDQCDGYDVDFVSHYATDRNESNEQYKSLGTYIVADAEYGAKAIGWYYDDTVHKWRPANFVRKRDGENGIDSNGLGIYANNFDEIPGPDTRNLTQPGDEGCCVDGIDSHEAHELVYLKAPKHKSLQCIDVKVHKGGNQHIQAERVQGLLCGDNDYDPNNRHSFEHCVRFTGAQNLVVPKSLRSFNYLVLKAELLDASLIRDRDDELPNKPYVTKFAKFRLGGVTLERQNRACDSNYWKHRQHHWRKHNVYAYSKFNDIFDYPHFSKYMKLKYAIKLHGGGKYALAKQAVTAYINAGAFDDYGMDQYEVMTMMKQASNSHKYHEITEKLKKWNDGFCPKDDDDDHDDD